MKTHAIAIKRSTWLSALLVGIAIALGSIGNARAHPAPEVSAPTAIPCAAQPA